MDVAGGRVVNCMQAFGCVYEYICVRFAYVLCWQDEKKNPCAVLCEGFGGTNGDEFVYFIVGTCTGCTVA